jgi:hypothetical protein
MQGYLLHKLFSSYLNSEFLSNYSQAFCDYTPSPELP